MPSQELRRKIAEVALSWVGTPFFPHMAKKGVGADCVNLVLAVAEEAGAVPAGTLAFPSYSLSCGPHLHSSIVVDWLSHCKWARRVEQIDLGNLITFKVGRVDHHTGIVVGPTTFVQSIRHYGVIVSDLRDSTWENRLQTIWELAL